MDESQIMVNVASTLAKDTYGWAMTRLEQARATKDAKKQNEAYEDIINGLLEDQNNLKMVANRYKGLYEEVSITDGDIQYLRDTIQRVIKLINEMNLEEDGNEENHIDDQSLEKFLDLIDKDTLKTMQLLGFNYKEAIGKPLTQICAAFIHKYFGEPALQQGVDEETEDGK